MNFNTKAIHKITGLTVRRIDYWDRTHFIKPSVSEASGHGSVRLYSFTDLVQMRVAKTLLDEGISLQKIRKAITYLKKNMPDVKKPLSQLKFVTDGSTLFVITRDEKRIIDVLRKGQLVFSIALGSLIEELKGKVIDMEAERKYEVAVKGRKYSVVLHADTEDGGYWVECPSLPGCSSQGDTVEEALEMIKDAIEGHLEILGEDAKNVRTRARKAR
ncbi:MAG: MerR family transcriptional regulator [Syntrophorhabdus sp.]|jgi:predicted RNase H-like HicB family nuclease|nr:MerR family transcriptional regulator [Syntrophorhabdus sp.]